MTPSKMGPFLACLAQLWQQLDPQVTLPVDTNPWAVLEQLGNMEKCDWQWPKKNTKTKQKQKQKLGTE